MLKVLCLLMGLGCPMVAQPPIWQTVFTNITTTAASANIKNSGQTQHLLYGNVTSNSPSTCTNLNNNYIRLEGSYDNSTFNAISIVEVSDAAGTWTVYGNGSYPFIRAKIVKLDVAGGANSCKVNAWYSGTFPTIPLQGSVVTKAYGQITYFNSLATASQFPLISSSGATATNSKWVVNFIDFTIHGATNYEIQEYTDSSCTVSIGPVLFAQQAAGATNKQFPYVDSGYWKATTTNSSLCISQSAAVLLATTVKYRWEE